LLGVRNIAYGVSTQEVLTMKRISSLLFLSVMTLLAAPAIQATPITFFADLSGPNEAPPNASPGTGFAIVVFDDVAHLLSVHVTFSDLLGNTTAAHIHCCVASPGTGTAGVATAVPTFLGFPLGVTAGTYDATFDTLLDSTWNPAFIAAHGGTPAGAEAFLFAGMLDGMAYFNIHTSQFPGGEIRGFLLVPEPATLALVCCGLLALGFLQRKRRR
jgi:hypothetical protein